MIILSEKIIKKFSRRNACVYFQANQEIITDIQLLLKDFFDNENVSRIPGGKWSVLVEENVADSNYEKIVLHQLPEPDITLFFNADSKRICILNNIENKWIVQNSLRLIRILLKLQCQQNDSVFLHGGFVTYNDYGLCVLGNKMSGKTSTILSLMKLYNVDFMSNDDVSFYCNGNSWKAEGWPRSIVVREDTWGKVGKYDKNIITTDYENNIQPLCFYPQNLCKLYSCNLIKEYSKLKLLVFPQFTNSSKVRIEIIPNTKKEELVLQNIMHNPGKYNDFLLPYFKDRSVDLAKSFMSFLHEIPAIYLYQSFEKLQEASCAIVDLLKEQ